MKIIFNGEEKILGQPLSVQELLVAEEMQNMMIAVARNGAFVPKSEYNETVLKDGDAIEIVSAMQGG